VSRAPADALASFGRAMAERGLRWYVFGAQAVLAYGRPRLTADVDVAVELAGAAASGLVAALAAHGFELRFPLTAAHLREARLLPMVHAPSAIPFDVVITAPGLDEELLDRARPTDLGGTLAPVISVEDLVALKILAGRRKDLEDVRGVLAEQRGRIELGRTRDVLAAFEAATGDHRLLARLERLVLSAAPEVPAGEKPRRSKRRP
jgi:predicted nucleotidyltransferase